MRRTRLLPVALALLAGCSGKERPAVDSTAGVTVITTTPGTSAPMVADTTPDDRHVFDLADGTEVWLTAGRAARSAGGQACRERGIELRRGGQRIPVPLLYTIDDPMLMRGRLVATLSTDCEARQSYRIDPATGQPTPMASGSR